jgi:hypothetical protein
VWDAHPYDISVTDYTNNTQLFNYQYSEQKSWRGPFGTRTFRIACWNEAGEQARKCKIGGFYRIKNVRSKMSRPLALPATSSFPDLTCVRNLENILEGSLNPDQSYPDKPLFEQYHPTQSFLTDQLESGCNRCQGVVPKKSKVSRDLRKNGRTVQRNSQPSQTEGRERKSVR